jgi:dCTP deaminase
VILCDHYIERAIQDGRFTVDPVPGPSQYNSSALDLRVGDDFLQWKAQLGDTEGITHNVTLDNISLHKLSHLTEPLPVNPNGTVIIPPKAFVLVRTHEYIHLPLRSKLAARVEGRSKQARLGMGVHITAPTIHAGFRGKIVLEILNHGPFHLHVVPNKSRLCQLVLEQVNAVPQRGGSATFSNQETPLGSPRSR